MLLSFFTSRMASLTGANLKKGDLKMAAKKMNCSKKLEARIAECGVKIYFFKLSGNKNLSYGLSHTMRGEIDNFVSEDVYLKELSFMMGSGECEVLWIAKGVKEKVFAWERKTDYGRNL